MSACPNFECLDYSQSTCMKYPACNGCTKLYNCNNCSNQATLIEGSALPCEMIRLPERCRFCAKRQADGFSPAEHCLPCLIHQKKDSHITD